MLTRHPVVVLTAAALLLYVAVWTADLLFRTSAIAAAVLVAAAILGVWLGRPGLNLRPHLANNAWIILSLMTIAAGAIAACGLRFLHVQTPYAISSFPHLVALLPGIFAVTAVEEALFRQGMYKWLDLRSVPPPVIVTTTALLFAFGHLGPLILGRSSLVAFHSVQTVYLVMVGWLLGQIRRVTDSWLMSWLAHASYNFVVLAVLTIS